MSKSDSPKIKPEDDVEVEIFKRVNRLKIKAGLADDDGPGTLSTEVIQQADNVVMEMSSLYPTEIKNMISAMQREWDVLKDVGDDEGKKAEYIEKLSNTANQIKDLGNTFGYTLMGYFGESLRDFLMQTDFSKQEHHIITKAHIDVMDVVFREHIKDDDGGDEAEELKRVVAVAIEKYSSKDAD